MSFGETILPEFDDEMARTRAVLATVTAESMDWKPDTAMRSIGWNVNHLAEIIAWTADILDRDEIDIAPVDGPKYETPTIDDPVQVLAKFDAAAAAARQALSAASDAKFAEAWTMKMGGQPLFTMTKGACLRRWVMNHTIHHRGILSVYLRMCGIDVTPVYDG